VQGLEHVKHTSQDISDQARYQPAASRMFWSDRNGKALAARTGNEGTQNSQDSK
jgi:hypothetical protein